MPPRDATNTKSLPLPQAIAAYLAAVQTKDVDSLALCFDKDARVHDENRDYRGIEAIKAWKRETDTKYRYVMEPLDTSVTGNIVALHARVTGEFPGSPIELDYTFTLADEKIISLQIH